LPTFPLASAVTARSERSRHWSQLSSLADRNSVERRLLGAATLAATGRRRAAVVFVALVTAEAGDVGQ
jgi:hypothetical protein